jgi:predicted TIM-barrel fold metal-dependent hydrolase
MVNEIIDCNFWFGTNYLNQELSVDTGKINTYTGYLSTNTETPTIAVSSYFSLYIDPVEGDNILADLINSNQSLIGSMIFPNYFISREQDFDKYLKKKYNEKFKFCRLYPKTHKYMIHNCVFKKIYFFLSKYRFPIIINLDEIDVTGNKAINWQLISDISQQYPDIPVIIDGGNSKELMFNGYFYQLLENSENIYLETHNLLGFNQIEDLSEKFGSKKLIFGSYYPFYPGYLSYERIKYARISQDDKDNIASGNIKTILNNIKL